MGPLFFPLMNFDHWSDFLFVGFCLVTVIQLFYYWFFFSRLAFYRAHEKTVTQTHPVSIVLCARDESRNLVANLPGILAQEYPYTHELVIVNDNSYDDSKFVLEQFQKEYKHMNVVTLTDRARFVQGKKFPLSVGIKASRYEVLLLTDADCVPASPHWIELMQQGFEEGTEVVLGYGPYKKRKGLLNKIIRFETFHTALQYLSYALAGKPYMGVGRNLCYRKELFYRHKGFSSHNTIPGGDDDLFINQSAHRHNTRIVINPDAFTYSRPKKTWSAWYKQKTRHYSTGRFYKAGHRFWLGLYAAAQFLFYPLMAAALLFCNWMWVVPAAALRLVSLMIVWFGAMNRLREKDLKPWFLFFDLWMMFYFILFLPATWKKVKPDWS
jgi:glycosyltransferase involved in cell wall biosynthesis